jgi:hypothetical protein
MAASCGGSSQSSASSTTAKPASGKITVRSSETLKNEEVTDGGVAGTGHFVVTLDMSAPVGALGNWTITSGTKGYAGLHGSGNKPWTTTRVRRPTSRWRAPCLNESAGV